MSAAHEHHEFGLVMPFVVCEDQGGPYNADAFVAGCRYGAIEALLKHKPSQHEAYEPSALVPQLDLLAMHEGYGFKAQEWEDDPFWSHVLFVRGGFDDEEDG